MSDYCTYWYAKAIKDCNKGVNVGFVSKDTISKNDSKKSSLDRIIDTGGDIFNAQTNIEWSGDANVMVSIVCFSNKEKSSRRKMLNGIEVGDLTPSLDSSKKGLYIKTKKGK